MSGSSDHLAHLVAAIRSCGLSQRQLAAKAGVDQAAISRLLAGKKREVSAATLVKLSQALGLPPGALLGEVHVSIGADPDRRAGALTGAAPMAENRAGAHLPVPAGRASGLAQYEAIGKALADARTVDAAKDVRDRAEAMRIYARQIRNRQIEVDAAELRLRAERRVGELLIAAKASGQISRGQPKKNCADEEQYSRVFLDEIGIDRKLSAKCQHLASLSHDRFEARIGAWRDKVLHEHERVTTVLLRAEQRVARDARLQHDVTPWPEGRYGVILADPPWRFEQPSMGSSDRSIENHYPTLSLEEICALPVPRVAADDCVLFLWVTAPQLAAGAAHEVMRAWGFEGRTAMVWVKNKIGMGHYVRNQHEHLLIATRGRPGTPRPADRPPSVFDAPRGRHSEKPEIVHHLIEHMYPDVPRLELFARSPRAGWDAWGNEVTRAGSGHADGTTLPPEIGREERVGG